MASQKLCVKTSCTSAAFDGLTSHTPDTPSLRFKPPKVTLPVSGSWKTAITLRQKHRKARVLHKCDVNVRKRRMSTTANLARYVTGDATPPSGTCRILIGRFSMYTLMSGHVVLMMEQ